MMVVPMGDGPPDLGVKGATLGYALKWRYPLSETLCAWAQQRPTDYQSRCSRYWDQWMVPVWGLQPLRRYPHRDYWNPPRTNPPRACVGSQLALACGAV